MTKIFADAKVLPELSDRSNRLDRLNLSAPELPTDKEYYLDLGIVRLLYDEVNRVLHDHGYAHKNATIQQPNFLPLWCAAYGIPGITYIRESEFPAVLITGIVIAVTEPIGLVRTVINVDNDDLVNAVRQAYEKYSVSFVEKS